MTSGRRPCTDCGRNSPQGRHASCHVLTILRERGRMVPKTELMQMVYPYRWVQRLPGEWPTVAPIDGCIATLRTQGHRVVVFMGLVGLRETAAQPQAPARAAG